MLLLKRLGHFGSNCNMVDLPRMEFDQGGGKAFQYGLFKSRGAGASECHLVEACIL